LLRPASFLASPTEFWFWVCCRPQR
jgi:hypothetical protein